MPRSFMINSRKGDFMIRVRATDGGGVAQPPADPQTGIGMSGQARFAFEVTSV